MTPTRRIYQKPSAVQPYGGRMIIPALCIASTLLSGQSNSHDDADWRLCKPEVEKDAHKIAALRCWRDKERSRECFR